MNISEFYDINKIVLSLEVALQIDGADYAEKNFDTIMNNIYNRIIRQYQVDLRGITIQDQSLYMGSSRNSALLFIENVSNLHGRLCGYAHISRFTGVAMINPMNVNYLGFDDVDFMTLLQFCTQEKYIPKIADAMDSIKLRINTINNCMEKKMILIMLVAYELGFYEVLASIAEILYFGAKK